MNKNQPVRSFFVLAAMGLALAAAACSPKVDSGGYVKKDDIKEQITEGKTSKEEVLSKLGSPSSQSSFGNEAWYYITSRKEAYAFLKPDITEQEVIRIEFDKKGLVSSVSTYDKSQSADINLVKRTTPTEGHTLGFFEQVLGNIGRFNKSDDKGTLAPGRRGGGR
jgi:outer membrane protein assembly factor BamE (lipoprotein component of BamABCDE complex)